MENQSNGRVQIKNKKETERNSEQQVRVAQIHVVLREKRKMHEALWLLSFLLSFNTHLKLSTMFNQT